MPGTGPLAFGSFTFDPASDGSVLLVPRVVVGRDGAGTAWLTTISDGGQAADQAPWPADVAPAPEQDRPAATLRWHDGSLSAPEWAHAVDLAVDRITSGPHDLAAHDLAALRKVVLARDVFAAGAGRIDPRVVLRRLAARYPDC